MSYLLTNNQVPHPSRGSDLVGQTFGRLTVRRAVGRTPCRRVIWECLCSCGQTRKVTSTELLSEHGTQSCGCLHREKLSRRNTTHGKSNTSEFKIWAGMRTRCSDPKHGSYPDYGGRGIRVCPEWDRSFETFYRDMGPRPSKGHSLDRINNDGNYEPGNCRWATTQEQAGNRRITVLLTVRGVTKPLVVFAREAGLNPMTVTSRLARGLDPETALSLPPRSKAGKGGVR